jgi:hypothetical protein
MTLQEALALGSISYLIAGVFVEWRNHKYAPDFIQWLRVPAKRYGIASKLYIGLGPIIWPLIAFWRLFKKG